MVKTSHENQNIKPKFSSLSKVYLCEINFGHWCSQKFLSVKFPTRQIFYPQRFQPIKVSTHQSFCPQKSTNELKESEPESYVRNIKEDPESSHVDVEPLVVEVILFRHRFTKMVRMVEILRQTESTCFL